MLLCCGPALHFDCLLNWLNVNPDKGCPQCRLPIPSRMRELQQRWRQQPAREEDTTTEDESDLFDETDTLDDDTTTLELGGTFTATDDDTTTLDEGRKCVVCGLNDRANTCMLCACARCCRAHRETSGVVCPRHFAN